MLMAIEEHGAGKQLVRFRSWPVWSFGGLLLLLLFALLSTGAALDGAWVASLLLGGVALLLALRMLEECANALMNILHVLKQREQVMYPISSDSPQHLEVVRGES
jgi:O-antigen biosynthesis protein